MSSVYYVYRDYTIRIQRKSIVSMYLIISIPYTIQCHVQVLQIVDCVGTVPLLLIKLTTRRLLILTPTVLLYYWAFLLQSLHFSTITFISHRLLQYSVQLYTILFQSSSRVVLIMKELILFEYVVLQVTLLYNITLHKDSCTSSNPNFKSYF